MGLGPGVRLGPYEIIGLLGAGGMGEVYRACDTRLGREVALKVLSEAKAGDPGALERFEREARAASALSHPNIVTIYDIGRCESTSYIAMELVEGVSLRRLLSEGPLETGHLLAIATQTARALAAAHAKGIVHRDLKPENIMVSAPNGSQDSLVKILDFGLAKLEVPLPSKDETSADTADFVTAAGLIMGTVGYMSPEQASGRATDFRSDQFSLGAILYEMATGRRAFQGATSLETLAAVLRDEPETIDHLSPRVPLPLQWAIKRCLAKRPGDRYASSFDLSSDLAIVQDNLDAPEGDARTERAHNLPVQRTALIGRDGELAAVKQLLLRPDVRLVVLTGPGGTGKTRLAVKLAEEVAQDFKGGVYFVSLAMISDSNLVAPTVAAALGLRESPGKPAAEALKYHLRQSGRAPLLVVLDNFEQVMAAAPLVAALLGASPAVKILVTSRSLLRLYGEHEFSVPPLSLPQLDRLPDLETLARNPAISLFLDRAASLKPGFRLTSENMRVVAEICSRLDGLPLAIELAAARIKLLSPAAMLARLQSRLQWLTGGARDLPQRQQTLRATLDWSYELLQPAEQKLFRRLSVFVSGCTFEAAEAVVGAFDDLDTDLLDAVASLVDKSLLLESEQSGDEARFRMLETIREYAAELLRESGEGDDVRRAHAAYCLVLAEEGGAQLTGPRRLAWLNRFDLEQENFRAALEWAVRTGNAEWGLRMGIALCLYWVGHAHPAEGQVCMRDLLKLPAASGLRHGIQGSSNSHVRGASRRLRAKALIASAGISIELGEFADAREALDAAVAIYRDLNDLSGIAVALNHLAVVYRDQGELAGARSMFMETMRLWQEAGDLVSAAHATSNLADVARAQGDHAAAFSLHQECQSIYRRLGDRNGLAWSLDHQGDVAREQGDAAAARALYEQALAMFREVGNQRGMARALTDLGNLACNEGDYAAAQKLYGEGLRLFSELGETRDITRVLEGMACAAAGGGNWERALHLGGAAGALRQNFKTPIPLSTKTHVERKLEEARRNLTSASAARAWMEGSRLTPQTAVEFALREGSE